MAAISGRSVQIIAASPPGPSGTSSRAIAQVFQTGGRFSMNAASPSRAWSRPSTPIAGYSCHAVDDQLHPALGGPIRSGAAVRLGKTAHHP